MRSALTATAVLLMVVAGGCRDDTPAPAAGSLDMGGQTVTVAKLLTVASGICDAADLAGHNPNSSRATFYGQSHDGLHLIARGLEAVDRNQSATLLEAKQKVETDFLAPAAGAPLTDDLRHLAEVTRTSLERFGVDAEPCPNP